ncbi:MAG: prepilin peptidase, partial [Actinomycetes bacterium]
MNQIPGLIPLLVVFGLVFGLVIGSFLNVVIHRVPLGLSIVSPGSACPNCGHEVRGYDNIPVVSWLVLRGRCRDCGHPISVRYPLVEAGTGVAFAVAAGVLGATVTEGLVAWVVFSWVVLSFAIALAAIDIDVHRLPNSLTLPFLVVVVIGMPIASALGGVNV